MKKEYKIIYKIIRFIYNFNGDINIFTGLNRVSSIPLLKTWCVFNWFGKFS